MKAAVHPVLGVEPVLVLRVVVTRHFHHHRHGVQILARIFDYLLGVVYAVVLFDTHHRRATLEADYAVDGIEGLSVEYETIYPQIYLIPVPEKFPRSLTPEQSTWKRTNHGFCDYIGFQLAEDRGKSIAS